MGSSVVFKMMVQTDEGHVRFKTFTTNKFTKHQKAWRIWTQITCQRPPYCVWKISIEETQHFRDSTIKEQCILKNLNVPKRFQVPTLINWQLWWCSGYNNLLWARRSGVRTPVGARFSIQILKFRLLSNGYRVSFLGIKQLGGMALTTHLLLVRRLHMIRAMCLLLLCLHCMLQSGLYPSLYFILQTFYKPDTTSAFYSDEVLWNVMTADSVVGYVSIITCVWFTIIRYKVHISPPY